MAVPITGYAGGPFISCSTNAALTLGQRVEAAPPQPARVAAARSRRAAAEPAHQEEELAEVGPMPTLLELIDDGLIDPGEQEVVASYKGSALTANLTRDGAIVYGSERFTDPAAFMAHLKKQGVMPRTADDGSKSIYISGVLLLDLRAQYWETRAGSAAGGSRRKPGGGRGGGRGGAAAGSGRGRKKKQEAEELAYAEEVEVAEAAPVVEAQHWVQCSRCETWRVVPDEHWPRVEADEREDWFCEDAWWDIATMEPFTGPCEKQ